MQLKEKDAKRRKTTAVIGGGVLGSLTGYELASRGESVIVLDAGDTDSATLQSLPWVNASGKRPGDYFDLCARAVQKWQGLQESIGGQWLFLNGNLHWSSSPHEQSQLLARREECLGFGYASNTLDPSEASEKYASIHFDESSLQIIEYPDEGYILPKRLLHALFSALTRLGGEHYSHCEVTRVAPRAEGGYSVFTETDELEVDRVVFAAGLGNTTLAADLGLAADSLIASDDLGYVTSGQDTMYRTIHGNILHTPYEVEGLPILHHSHLTLLPTPDGTYIHSLEFNDLMPLADDPVSTYKHLIDELLSRACQIIPAMADAEIGELTQGKRPLPYDRLPMLGRLPAGEDLWAIQAHSGFSCGPEIVDLLSDAILEDREVPARWNVARFNT